MKKGLSLTILITMIMFGIAFNATQLTQPAALAQENPTPTPDHNAHHGDTALTGTVWVANEAGNSLSIIDAASNTVLTTLTGIEGPHNVQVSSDGTSAWAISGHDSVAVKIDAATYAVLGSVPTGSHPAHVIVSPDGAAVYVTNAEDNSVSVIDAETLEVITTIEVGEYPHGLRPSPDGNWVYVANVNSNTVSVIDATTNTKVTDIEVGERPVQVGFAPDGQTAYVSLNGENALARIDVAMHTLMDKVAVGTGPIQVFVTPDNASVLVANQGTEDAPGTTVSFVDTATFTVVAEVETDAGAHGIVIEPSGTFAYIANIYADTVTVLAIADQSVAATLPVGNQPNGISFSPLAPATAPAETIALTIASEGATGEAGDEDHAAHHPEGTAEAVEGDMMGGGMMSMMADMQGMMDMMMDMEMSDDMHTHMEDMHAMMEMMMSGDMMSMMADVQGMMDMMMGMEMSDDMRTHMEDMHAMMEMMMSGDHSSSDGHDQHSTTEDDTAGEEHQHGDTNSGADQHNGHHGAISAEGVSHATETIGAQPLEYREEDGFKVFEITAQPVIWNILDAVEVVAWTYNGTVPGPMIRVTEGDQVRVVFRNELPQPTTVHWHGVLVPNAMDGIPGVTQEAVLPGETFVYEFTANPAGSFMYHSHFESDTQVSIGLYAPIIIDPAEPEVNPPDVDVTLMLSEWRVVDGQIFPAMPMAGMEPNYFTINGKAFPNTEPINVKVGDRVRIRVMGIGQFIHPLHLHGMPFQIVATDGYPVPEGAQLTKDTISIAPGERYDIEFIATEPGQWMLHCHILHHTTNDGVDDGGMMLMVNVTE